MYLAIREMRFAKVRYSLIGIIMLLVAFLVLFVTGLAQGLAYDNAASIQNMDASHFIMEKDSNHRFTRSQIDEQVTVQAGLIAGAENVQPLGVHMTTVTAEGNSGKMDVTYLGIKADGWIMPSVTEGEALSLEGRGQVVVDSKMKELGIGVGSVIVDQTTGLNWTVGGFVSHESFSHSPVVFLNENDWRHLQESAVRPDENGTEGGLIYNAIAVKSSNEEAKQLAAALPDAEIITKSDAVSAIPGYKEEQGSLLMMIVFLYIISSFVLAVFFYVITIQKTSQFGILKAIGTPASHLARSVALQVMLIAISSLLVSVMVVQAVEALLPSGMPFRLPVSALLLTSAAFIAMSLAGSLLSVWKVAKIDALDAIGRTAT
ncbi:ABC transporter permease [Paenibacillus sp. GCM10027627]|uniref:ABC transporter permease n=1 Tax=unclassified Paenibacillus TaxID=185978 RepID=UPI00362F9A56